MGVFKQGLKDDESYLNGIGRLEAVLEGEGDAKWFQNGREIPADASCLKFERVIKENGRALIIKNCVQADFCKYEIEVDGEKSGAELKTMSPFVAKMQDQKAAIGYNVAFEVEVRPAVQVAWFAGEAKISTAESDKYEQSASENTRTLLVKDVTAADFKSFSCEAKGERCTAKLAEDSAPAVVAPPAEKKAAAPAVKKDEKKKKSSIKDDKKKPRKGIQFDETPEVKVDSAAAFATKVPDIRTQEGHIEVFKCKLKDEKQTVVWFSPDEKEINKDNYSILKYETAEDGAFRKLIVKNIQKGDGGQYKCVAGDSKIKFKLNVGGAKHHTLQVDGMNLLMKRRGSKVDANKEHVLKRALGKHADTYKWIRHPDYMNLWIINPTWATRQEKAK